MTNLTTCKRGRSGKTIHMIDTTETVCADGRVYTQSFPYCGQGASASRPHSVGILGAATLENVTCKKCRKGLIVEGN